MDRSILRTFIAYVEDRPGVLNRVASLFRRRAYNIQSLTVGRTHQPSVSRLTQRSLDEGASEKATGSFSD